MKFINEDTAVIYYIELKADDEGKILIEAENYNIGYNLISEGLYKFYSNSLNALKTFIAYGYYPNRSDNAKLQELFSMIESKAHEDVMVESIEDEIESWGVLITLDGKFFDMIASFDSEDDAYEYIKNREEQDHAEEMYGLEYEVVSLNDYSDFEINEDDLFEIEEIDNE